MANITRIQYLLHQRQYFMIGFFRPNLELAILSAELMIPPTSSLAPDSISL